MHLLIDVRTSTPSDIVHLQYAESWADLWIEHHRDDEITFLAFEGDPLTENKHKKIFLSRSWQLFPKKLATHAYGPHRIISFSKLPSIDSSIPTLLHVSDVADRLYPHKSGSFIEHLSSERQYKKLFHRAHHIIIPDREIGENLSELFGVSEHDVSIIPYIHPEDLSYHKKRSILPHGVRGEYFVTEGTPGDEWRPIELLQVFARYVYNFAGKRELIIVGDLGGNLGIIMTMIRSLDLFEHVKLVGVLTKEERSTLYVHAAGWIYIGHYYSRGASVSLAAGYHIPLYISDVPGLRDYSGSTFHPNHLDRLPGLLQGSDSEKMTKPIRPNNNLIMEVYTRIIAM